MTITTVLANTGTRSINGHHLAVQARLATLPQFDEYVTGACLGFDALAGYFYAVTFGNNARHTIVVPYDRSQVHVWWTVPELSHVDFNIVEMPEPRVWAERFKERNIEMVERGTDLMYCAECPEDDGKSKRSGTWQTIRLARKADLEIREESMILCPA